jgi:hypothetical protein
VSNIGPSIAAVVVTAAGLTPLLLFGAARSAVVPPPPFEAPSELVAIGRLNALRNLRPSSYPKYTFLREHTHSIDVAAVGSMDLKDADENTLQVEAVTDNFFRVLRLSSSAGRVFQPDDFARGEAVVVLR